MKLVQAGRHIFNLEFLIRHEVNDGSIPEAVLPSGTVRVTMAPGTVIDLTGPAADSYLRAVADAMKVDSSPAPATVIASRPVRANPGKRVDPSASGKNRKKRS